jgi:hypothetical protein
MCGKEAIRPRAGRHGPSVRRHPVCVMTIKRSPVAACARQELSPPLGSSLQLSLFEPAVVTMVATERCERAVLGGSGGTAPGCPLPLWLCQARETVRSRVRAGATPSWVSTRLPAVGSCMLLRMPHVLHVHVVWCVCLCCLCSAIVGRCIESPAFEIWTNIRCVTLNSATARRLRCSPAGPRPETALNTPVQRRRCSVAQRGRAWEGLFQCTLRSRARLCHILG